jgi:hypothetical protein
MLQTHERAMRAEEPAEERIGVGYGIAFRQRRYYEGILTWEVYK